SFAEAGIVVLDQSLEVVGLLKRPKNILAREFIDGHVLEFVVAKDLAVAPRACRAVVLQKLGRMLLIVPLVERGFLFLGDRRAHDEDGNGHVFPPAPFPRRREAGTEWPKGVGGYKCDPARIWRLARQCRRILALAGVTVRYSAAASISAASTLAAQNLNSGIL